MTGTESEVPHDIQQHMSFEKIPVLGNMLPTFKLYIMAWKKLRNLQLHLQKFIDEGLKWVEEYFERV